MTLSLPTLRPRVDWLGIIACVFVGCLVVALSWFKLSSLDIGYHLSYGRSFLDHGTIVQRDPALYPQTAITFINANWGSQVIMALAERLGGSAGLITLRMILIGLTFGFIAAVVREHVSGWLAVAAAWMLAALGGYERFSMRPELFSYALMSAQLWLLTRGIQSRRSILALAILQLLWVNLHSYFLVGVLLTGVWFAAGVLKRMLEKLSGTATDLAITHRRTLIFVAVLSQIAACFVNPWHMRGALFPIATLKFLTGHQVISSAGFEASTSAWSLISEFQSPFHFLDQSINYRTIDSYLLLLGIGLFGAMALVIRGRLGEAMAIGLFFIMSIKMRRNIAQFAFVAAPLSIIGLSRFFPVYRINESLKKMLRYIFLIIIASYASFWIARIADGRFYYEERRISREFGVGYSDRTFSRGATRWLTDQNELQPNLFVDYFSSSNTMPWLPARYQLFVNTNTFAYEESSLATAFKLGLGEIDHNRFFERYDVNVVLLHCGPDTQMLIRNMNADDGAWALVYFDQHNVIFIRRTAQHVDVIRKNRINPQQMDAKKWIASTVGPSYARALSLGTMVNVPMSLGWSGPAAMLMEEAIQLAPDYDQAWHYLGVCHGNSGNVAARNARYVEAERHWNQAVRCFRKVIALKPDHPEAVRYLELTMQRLKMLGER